MRSTGLSGSGGRQASPTTIGRKARLATNKAACSKRCRRASSRRATRSEYT